jgi:cytochrome c
MWSKIGLVMIGLTAFAPAAQAEGDAVKGKTVFARCSTCHSLTAEGAKPMGPHLQGIFGRSAGTIEGAHFYSDAMKTSGIVWDEAALDKYLAAPAQSMPGTTMMIGVADAQQRADLIAYLKEATKAP